MQQLFVAFNKFWMQRNAIDRAYFATLWRIEVSHAFRAFQRIDDIELIAHPNRIVGTFGFADVAVNAFVGNHERHKPILGGRSLPHRESYKLTVQESFANTSVVMRFGVALMRALPWVTPMLSSRPRPRLCA